MNSSSGSEGNKKQRPYVFYDRLIGGLRGVLQDSTFDSVTMTGILFHFSSYWSI
jgi:hypothetical protein